MSAAYNEEDPATGKKVRHGSVGGRTMFKEITVTYRGPGAEPESVSGDDRFLETTLGLQFVNGLRQFPFKIGNVRPNTWAATQGLQPGDILTYIDETELQEDNNLTPEDYRTMFAVLRPLTLSFVRKIGGDRAAGSDESFAGAVGKHKSFGMDDIDAFIDDDGQLTKSAFMRAEFQEEDG